MKNTNKSFSGFTFGEKGGVIFDYSDNKFPTVLHAYNHGEMFELRPGSTYFVYQYEGRSLLHSTDKNMESVVLCPEQYACIKSKEVSSISFLGQALVIEKLDYFGMHTFGGPIESLGRLKYIDGCTDSLLIPPVKLGDPCLNALFFPRNINQTQHTHPSMRVGIVIRGKGECITPEGNIPLVAGLIFIIHEDGLHSFKTDEHSGMVVIAYHPDSDFGPTDEEHPMINRTIVEGVSAKDIPEIQTK